MVRGNTGFPDSGKGGKLCHGNPGDLAVPGDRGEILWGNPAELRLEPHSSSKLLLQI